MEALDECYMPLYKNRGEEVVNLMSIKKPNPLSKKSMNTYITQLLQYQTILKADNENEDVYHHVFMETLDETTKKAYKTKLTVSEKAPTVKGLINFLRITADGIEEKEKIEVCKEDPKLDFNASKKHNGDKFRSTQQQTFVTTNECLICSQGHATRQCPEILNSNDRIETMKAHKLCLYCGLHRWKKDNPCRMRENLKCPSCNGNHVDWLHPKPKRMPAMRKNYVPYSQQNQ